MLDDIIYDGTVCVFAVQIKINLWVKIFDLPPLSGLSDSNYSCSLTHIFPMSFPKCDVTDFPPLTSNRWCQIHFPVSVNCALTVSDSPEVAYWPALSPAGFPAFSLVEREEEPVPSLCLRSAAGRRCGSVLEQGDRTTRKFQLTSMTENS